MPHNRLLRFRSTGMWTYRDVVAHLLRHRLLTEQNIVEGALTVSDLSRRNRNFSVVGTRVRSCLVKQGVGEDRMATLAHEAAVYQWLWSCPGLRDLRRCLPRCYGYDAGAHVLVLEFFRGGETSREYHVRRRRIPIRLAHALGRALATLHQLETRSSPVLQPRVPWVLLAHRPHLGMLQDLNGAAVRIVEILQGHQGFSEALDQVRDGWHPTAPTHFDIRWENCLVVRRGGRAAELKIIDWELANLGDPAWDVGSVFSSFLAFWIASIPVAGGLHPARLPALAEYPLTLMHPAIAACWEGYVRGAELGRRAAGELQLRAVRYAAAALIQTALEDVQKTGELTGHEICLLQVSRNMLRRPEDAAMRLLGLPVGGRS